VGLFRSPAEPSGVPSTDAVPPTEGTSVIVGSDSELRTLLRGLLRLRRFQIAGESDGGAPAEELLDRVRPNLLVIDAGASGDRAGPLVQWSRSHLPRTRIVLIGSWPPTPNVPQRPDAVVARPFRIKEFEAAVDPARAG